MTRKQAEKIAAAIVKAAREKGRSESINWTRVWIDVADIAHGSVEQNLRTLDENLGLIVGCLPMGWRLNGNSGDSHVEVIRAN